MAKTIGPHFIFVAKPAAPERPPMPKPAPPPPPDALERAKAAYLSLTPTNRFIFETWFANQLPL